MSLYLSDFVELSGKLISIKSFSFPELPNQLAYLNLQFEKTNYFIKIQENTDEIDIVETINLENMTTIATHPIWMQFIGKELLWAWLLINSQGYRDGIRFEFKGINTAVELVAISSSLKIYKIEEI